MIKSVGACVIVMIFFCICYCWGDWCEKNTSGSETVHNHVELYIWYSSKRTLICISNLSVAPYSGDRSGVQWILSMRRMVLLHVCKGIFFSASRYCSVGLLEAGAKMLKTCCYILVMLAGLHLHPQEGRKVLQHEEEPTWGDLDNPVQVIVFFMVLAMHQFQLIVNAALFIGSFF